MGLNQGYMSLLEAFGIIILMIVVYCSITIAWGLIITDGNMNKVPWVAWFIGMLMFVATVALWSSGRPFF